MPHLNAFYEKYSDDVEVVAVNLAESSDVVLGFISKNGYSFPVILDPERKITQAYGVRYTNYHVLINRDGQIVNAFGGDIAERHFEQLITSE